MTDAIPRSVLVMWDDHHISMEEVSREDAAKITAMPRYSTGFLWADTDAGVVLAMDWGPSKPDHADPHLFIDRRLIREVIPLHAGPVLGDEE